MCVDAFPPEISTEGQNRRYIRDHHDQIYL